MLDIDVQICTQSFRIYLVYTICTSIVEAFFMLIEIVWIVLQNETNPNVFLLNSA